MQKVLGIDGTHMKHRLYNGVILALVGRDGNNQNIVLTVGVVPSETAEGYNWFLDRCRANGLQVDDILISCDRCTAIFASTLADLNSIHFIRHAIQNVKTECSSSFGIELQRLVWEAQSCQNEGALRSTMTILRNVLPRAANYLEAIEPATRVLFPHLHSTPLYGWRTTNIVESTNSASIPTREMDPFHFLVYRMAAMMAEACLWQRKGHIITPYATTLLTAQHKQAPLCSVLESSSTRLYINDTSAPVTAKRRVDLAFRTYTCGYKV
ncbi:hypothetical protein ACHHYP_20536 [Achlya hypogyna]|uniref:MULE transposase domain-containing protein n=1 Tax=Achlya hypogyna TaxID=1202772 RepID=A0A1V9YJD7_ACHHY|nr:hypothetical protein ACHHYP_20536 [Achlya hypogyna]